jgi:hypothetical protein
LIINDENFRFDPVSNQEEALKIMIENQGNKLLKLIESILTDGLNPSELFVLNSSNYVLEGNRRTTSLKLIVKPDLIKNIDSVFYKKLIKKLKDYPNHYYDNDTEVRCIVFLNEEDANKWIQLKHTGTNQGIGIEPWDSTAKERFKSKATGVKSLTVQILEYIENNQYIDNKYKNKSISTTNLERLLLDPRVRSSIGLEYKNKLLYKAFPDKEVAKGLNKILNDLINNDLKVKEIYNREKRLEYLSTFNKSDFPDIQLMSSDNIPLVDIKTKQSEKINMSNQDNSKNIIKNIPNQENYSTKIKSNNVRDNRKSTDRKSLIPPNLNIKVKKNSRINDIYRELKVLEVKTCTNATAVLFRIFIELSIDEFIETFEIVLDPTKKDTLKYKLSTVLDFLKKNNKIKKNISKPINIAISNNDSITSIDTFNSYIHNKNLFPNYLDLLTAWNNYEKFLEIIHIEINNR